MLVALVFCLAATSLSFKPVAWKFKFNHRPSELSPSSSKSTPVRGSPAAWLPHKRDYTFVTDEQWLQLSALAELMTEWNEKVNLISRKDIDALIPTHIAPCLAINLFFEETGSVFPKGSRIIDVGTGGGLPGLPLAICNPTSHFTLVDSNGKKMMVVEDIKNKLNLHNVHVLKTRAENFKDEKFDYILGRSVSAVPTFLGFSSHLVDNSSAAVNSGLLYIKGGEFKEELEEAGITIYELLAIRDLTQLDTDKNLLHIPALEICNFYEKKVNLKDKKERTNRKRNKLNRNRS